MTSSAVPAHDLDVILGRPSARGVAISLLSPQEARAVRVVVEPGGFSRPATLKPGEPQVIEVSGLRGGGSYRYRVESTASTSLLAAGEFRTAPPPGTSFRFVVQADSHLDDNTNPAVYMQTLANMAADRPDFLVDLGDTFMVDKFRPFETAKSQYLAQRFYLGQPGLSLPLLLVTGNHDGEVGWASRESPGMTEWARGMRERYFPKAGGSDFYASGPSGTNSFAWQWGDALFVVLDPFGASTARARPDDDGWVWTLGKPQIDWLDQTLSASKARHRLVFIHHLVGGHPGSRAQEARGGAEASRFFEWGGQNGDGSASFATKRPGFREPIHDLLRRQGVELVFHGHDHLYARQERDGIVYQAVPQPGHRAEVANHSGAEYGYASGEILGSSGYLRVTVGPGALSVDYVRSRLSEPRAATAHHYAVSAPGARK